jgi:hypothetical protein
MFNEEKMKNPHKFPVSMRVLKPSPGPGEYVYENSEYYKKNKSFQKENSAAFGIDENRKIEVVDKV